MADNPLETIANEAEKWLDFIKDLLEKLEQQKQAAAANALAEKRHQELIGAINGKLDDAKKAEMGKALDSIKEAKDLVKELKKSVDGLDLDPATKEKLNEGLGKLDKGLTRSENKVGNALGGEKVGGGKWLDGKTGNAMNKGLSQGGPAIGAARIK